MSLETPALSPHQTAEDAAVAHADSDSAFNLSLEAFSGPLDLLLELARQGKTDLTKVSMSHLATQYLEFIGRMEEKRYHVASEYLVMACVLVLMKSRLLLPKENLEEDEENLLNPEYIAMRLQHLQVLKDNMARLRLRPTLGKDFFLRGKHRLYALAREAHDEQLSLVRLYRCYARMIDKRERPRLNIEDIRLFTIHEALETVKKHLSVTNREWQDWSCLWQTIEDNRAVRSRYLRSIITSLLIALLELSRRGDCELMQADSYQSLHIRGRV